MFIAQLRLSFSHNLNLQKTIRQFSSLEETLDLVFQQQMVQRIFYDPKVYMYKLLVRITERDKTQQDAEVLALNNKLTIVHYNSSIDKILALFLDLK